MRIFSWNVNGLRSVAKKGFSDWLSQCGGDVVGLQEVRAPLLAIPKELFTPHGYQGSFTHAEKPGYSGVGLFTRQAPETVIHALGAKELDVEARLQIACFGRLTVANAYFPNGKGSERDNSRVPHKLRFYRKLFGALKPALQRGEPVLVMGDFNTAHCDIDLARPKDNRKVSGFLDEERAELDAWLRAGWVDTFRHFEKGPGHYTWWSNRPGVRERNIGWRIDYVFASPGAMPFLRSASIHPMVFGSDHCPISVELDDAITGS
jgi:exodeoxyribonuclease III